ncbi:MAG: hypothetical protein H7Y32_11410, partial [Chloroflexales bacterium]|nr:hypothetical protein [Chloroflexales bacterium]
MMYAPPQPQLTPGQTMANGRYTVQAVLPGRSAYAATDHEAFDRTVVLKALRAQPAA